MTESSRTSETHQWRLKPLVAAEDSPAEGGDIIEIASALTLGRDPGNDVVLDEERYPHVSGHHARVYLRGDALWVEDLNSKNGTFVNGTQVQQQPVRGGDSIQLGPLGPRFAVIATAGGQLKRKSVWCSPRPTPRHNASVARPSYK